MIKVKCEKKTVTKMKVVLITKRLFRRQLATLNLQKLRVSAAVLKQPQQIRAAK